MKVACLLLCLALARLSAGHIFRRQPNQMDNLIVQPLQYISQEQLYQQEQQYPQAQFLQQNQQYLQQQNQHKSSEERTQSKSSEERSQSKSSEERTQPKSSEEHTQHQRSQYQQRSHHHHQDKHQNQRLYQEKDYQTEQYQRQHKQYQSEQYQQQQPQQRYGQEYQQTQQNQQAQKRVGDHSSSDSTSAESHSQEHQSRVTRVTIDKYYATPRFANVESKNPRFNAARNSQERIKATSGEVIAWKNVKIAAGPNSPVRPEDIEKIFKDAYDTMSKSKKISHEAYEAAANADNEDAHLNATQLLNKYQYNVEEHTIKTDDGYYLTLFRIQPKEQTLVQKPVVFLMHGLLGSADDWLLMGPGKSLAYLLADAGYEVWLGNARGSKYSRRHVSKHPAQSDFWQFSNDEIALNDLPAMIDYALKTSNQEKLYYVGHSQGTTAFFALASERPEYNEKIIMMHALSPMVYMSNVRSPMLRMISPNSPFYTRLHEQLGHGQFKPSKELVHTAGGAMCESEIGCKNVCSNVNFVMSGVNVDDLDVEMIPVIMAHLPAGASTRQIKQYGQAVASQEFTKYNYGAEMNQKVYGDSESPKYNMENVKTPVALYYSEKDWLAHPRDVQRLEKELPNVKDSYKVPEQNFSHMDFQFSKNAPDVVYKRLIESIQKHQNNKNYVY